MGSGRVVGRAKRPSKGLEGARGGLKGREGPVWLEPGLWEEAGGRGRSCSAEPGRGRGSGA